MSFDLLGSLSEEPSRPREATADGADGRGGTGDVQCSRRGCRAAASWRLLWNNPRIHDAERRKVWVACDEHREHLADFLRARGFLRDVLPLGSADESGASR